MSCKYICGEYEVTYRLSRLIGACVKIARLGSSMYGQASRVLRPIGRISLLNENVKEERAAARTLRENRHPRCPFTG